MLFYEKFVGNKQSDIQLIWLHGWGQDHRSFLSISSFFKDCKNYLIDFAGFGRAKTPDNAWDTEDYAKHLNLYLSKKSSSKKTYLIGHSFGCRVALRYAYLFPKKIDGIILISAAGLKKKRSLFFRIKASFLKILSKIMAKIDQIFGTNLKEAYSNKFGSRDYRNARGIMKKVFVKTISEDLSKIASKINVKTLLIYGALDNETPPEFGVRYNKMISGSQFIELPNFDHYTILSSGKYQLQSAIEDFIRS